MNTLRSSSISLPLGSVIAASENITVFSLLPRYNLDLASRQYYKVVPAACPNISLPSFEMPPPAVVYAVLVISLLLVCLGGKELTVGSDNTSVGVARGPRAASI